MLGASFAATRMYVLTKIPPPRPPDGMIFLVLCFSTSAHQAFNESTHTHDARTKNKNKNKQLQLNTRGGSSACIYLTRRTGCFMPPAGDDLPLSVVGCRCLCPRLSLSRRRCPSDDVVTCQWTYTHTRRPYDGGKGSRRGGRRGRGGAPSAPPPPSPPSNKSRC